MKSRKKAQMEIMGLAIVMVLIILGFLFVVRLRQFQGTSIREEFQETQFASNMLNSILKTTSTDCYGYDMTALYQDCMGKEYNGKYVGSTQCGNGMTSCDYINQTLFTLFNATLLDWNRRFEYTACEYNTNFDECQEDGIIHSYVNQGCTRLQRERKTIPIPGRLGVVMIKLDLC